MVDSDTETQEERKLVEKIIDRIQNSPHFQAFKERISREKNIAIIVDGPNFLRKIKDRQIKLEEIDEIIKDLGKPIVKKVILNEFAGEKLIQAIANSGYEPIVSSHDIYLSMSIEVMDVLMENRKIDSVIIASRHARTAPILLKIKEKGKETAIVGFEPGMSTSVKKIADHSFMINY
ncbi:MAG: NYN domain-containing protein [Candidatus Heimdallarchaeota archaeon]|nr:NYN domain-containing protein [Candidatus Heimdallarchaeota archaeon]